MRMGDYNSKKDIYKIEAAICVMLFVSCSIWLFDGIIGWKKITVLAMGMGLLILLTKKITVSRFSAIWLLYPAVILLSWIINHTFSKWFVYVFLLYCMIICYAMLVDCEVNYLKIGVIFLAGLGIFHGIAVIVHFVFKEKFNGFYFPFLKHNGSLSTATSYYDRGYFFGLDYKPHETAGLIVFAIAALGIWALLQKEYKKKMVYVIPTCLMFPLLLTGKKGVTACMLVGCMLILLVWYASKKQWMKIGIAVGGAAILMILAVWYIATHLDNPLFYRFASFFERLTSGQSVDAGRGGLQDAAWQLWEENKIWGVGWFQFNGYTVNRFGYPKTHSVNLDYLQFLCETGIIGFAFMITPIIVMARRTFIVCKNTLKNITEKSKQWIILFAVFVQLFTLMYAFIEVPFYTVMYFAIYIFSCMIINNAYKELNPDKAVWKIWKRIKKCSE